MTDQPTTILPALQSALTQENLATIVARLTKGRDEAIAKLQAIKPLDPKDPSVKEKYEAGKATLITIKKYYEKMNGLRKQITDPVKEAIDLLTSYENTINPTAKTVNEYTKARGIIEAYDQLVLTETAKAKYAAEQAKKLEQYKADLRAAVQRQLNEMISGKQKNVVQSMVTWESKLTLATIDTEEKKLKEKTIKLALADYDGCFRMPAVKDAIMNDRDTIAFIDGLRTDYPYEKYNEEFVRMVAEIVNACLAKIPDIKVKLAATAGDEAAANKRRLELETKAAADLKAIDEEKRKKDNAISDQADLNKQEADWREQGMTQDLPDGPSKKVIRLGDMPVKQFTLIVSHSISHPEFPSFFKKGKQDYIDPIDWWLKFFAANIDHSKIEGLEGLIVEERAKTIIRS